MKKAIKLLDNVNNFNSFIEVPTLDVSNGNTYDLYLRIIQTSTTDVNSLRWLPSSAATAQVTFENLDSALQFTRTATMAFPSDDRSIWKVSILATDIISGAIKFVLTDGAIVESILLDGRLKVSNTDNHRFYC